MMSLRCSSCNINFNDKGSLEVHYSYNHSHLLPDGARAAEPDAEPGSGVAESNNNHQHFFKYHHNLPDTNHDESPSSVMTAISPGNATESRDFHLPLVAAAQHCAGDRLYDLPPPPPSQQQQHHHHNYDTYLMNSSQEYARGSPAVLQNAGAGGGYPFSEQRYQPYYKHQPASFREVPRAMVEPTILRCDKCNMQYPSQEMLLHHYHLVHSPIPGLGPHPFNPRFGNGPVVNGGAEPQAEILDLDSHKVHVYQPPNGEDSQDSDHRSMDPWARDEKKYFHQQLQLAQQNGNVVAGGGSTTNGRGGSTPLPSPDFGSVSTTTDNIEALQSSTRSPYYEHNSSGGGSNSLNSTPAQISSSDNNNPTTGRSSSSKGSGGKNSNGTWKSNEARRPKTYNCSACNKWFTSSGHLKRHYNTTLHKNAVKQSGAPDPATLPVSAHHHPQKETSPYPSSRQAKGSPPTESDTPPSAKLAVEAAAASAGYRNPQPSGAQQQQQPPSQPTNAFMHNPPNLMAGPSEVPGGLLHPSYTQSRLDLKSPSPITSLQLQQQQTPPQLQPPHSNHTSYLGFAAATQAPTLPPFFHQPTPTTLYPNFKSPHVSTTQQVTITNSHTGNLTQDAAVLNACSAGESAAAAADSSKLPSFACIQKNMVVWNAEQFLSTLDNGNVGGPFSSKDVENATNMLLTTLSVEIKPEPVSESEDENEQLPQPSRQPPPLLMLEDTNVSSSTGSTSPLIPDTPVAGAGGGDKPTFSCDRCLKFFNKACYLTQHNKSFHSGFKPFKCARCGKRFPDSVQFKIHSDKHAGDKPYKCEICPKAFNHKTDLRRHACLHTNIRPYNCDICSKGFIRKDHMLKHRETHQNRKSVQRKFKGEKLKKELELMEVTC